ncbi:MAG: peptidylprolyl isomerase [Candidatus Binatia bacterium]
MRGFHWRNRTAIALAVAGLTWAVTSPGWAQEKKAGSAVIADGKQVSLEFTLTLEDKTQVQSNVGKDPLVYKHGASEIVPGLEKQLAGLKVGDTKHVEVPPEEAYGPVDPNRTQEVEKDKVPEGARKIGSKLTGRAPNGQMMFAEVKEVKDKTVVLDMNHPLAGKKLIFDVKVLKIEDAPAEAADAPAPQATPGK